MVIKNKIFNGTATAVIRKRKQGLSISSLERRKKITLQWFIGKPYW